MADEGKTAERVKRQGAGENSGQLTGTAVREAAA
jgi:hypothetical protein